MFNCLPNWQGPAARLKTMKYKYLKKERFGPNFERKATTAEFSRQDTGCNLGREKMDLE